VTVLAAALVDTKTLVKVVLYSLGIGIGIAVVFGAGVSSTAAFVDAVRERRTAAGVGWAMLAIICLAGALAAVVVGVVVMSTK
jgi:hypothetical protein